MKKHTKIYFDHFKLDISSYVTCEICDNQAVDIHHISARGMGGNPKGDKDVIENLQALCRSCHDKYGDITKHMQFLIDTHLKFMDNN